MNRPHIRAVRDALNTLAETGKSPVWRVGGFDMEHVEKSTDCGTACCFIGWSGALMGEPPGGFWRDDAQQAWELSWGQSFALFCPAVGRGPRTTRDPRHGVAILDWLLTQPDDVSPEAIAAKWVEVVP